MGGGWDFLEAFGDKGFTWNPASGCSITDCAVRQRGACWAEKIVKRLGRFCPECPSFRPHGHPKNEYEPIDLKEPATITPVSTGDLFGLNRELTDAILDIVRAASWHRFLILTKAPYNALDMVFPENVWFGTTVNRQEDIKRLWWLMEVKAKHKWAVFEPLYSQIETSLLPNLDWIIIGSQTRPTVQPKREWIEGIIEQAKGVPVWMKKGLDYAPHRQESPATREVDEK